ncbi:MAG: hypothetical protein FWE71_16960 [Nocardioidaceae bacterium]|nr:hypothetical protein [Nocardioidaceae bacterium]MCL2612410.1 hypothetical protein [Nocardioidaceae bacterium]
MISARRFAGALLALLVTAAGVAAMLIPSPAMAATWKQTDHACYHNAVGQMCLTTFVNGDKGRATVALAPSSGHWMELTDVAESELNAGGAVCVQGSGDAACPARTHTAHTYTYPAGVGMIVSASVNTDKGSFQGAAGRTPWAKAAAQCVTVAQGQACVQVWIRLNRLDIQRHAAAKLVPAKGSGIKPLAVRIAVKAGKTLRATKKFTVGAQAHAWTGAGQVLGQPSGTYKGTTGKFTFSAGGTTYAVSVTSDM